jgi:hypothetical protein
VVVNARRNVAPDEPALVPVTDEQILHVRPLSDRVIVATSLGRVIALDLGDGQPLWQARPTDRVIERLLATDDFVAAVFNDEISLQVVAVDSSTGQTALRRVFSRDGFLPVNFALAPDGKLIWVTHETLVAKDLFDPSDRPTFSRTVRGGASSEGAFGVEARNPDQLQVFEGYIAVLADGGQFIRVFNLDDGRPVTVDSRELRQALDYKPRTDASDFASNVQMLTVGTRLYAVGRFTLRSHDVERPRNTWNRNFQDPLLWQAREAVATADLLLILEDMLPQRRTQVRQGGQPVPSLRIVAFNRTTLPSGVESGKLEHEFVITEPSGIPERQYQVVDGGIAYVTGDQKLKLLRAVPR